MIDSIIQNFKILFTYLLIFINSSGYSFSEIPENKVLKVIDGDTLEIYQNQKIEKIRMIGINTPESVDPRKELECFGIEASEKLKETLQGKIIRTIPDNSQDDRDKFGRLLRYVYLENENINKKMIEEGFAFEYTFKKPYKYQKEFREKENLAKSKNIGLWNKESCNY